MSVGGGSQAFLLWKMPHLTPRGGNKHVEHAQKSPCVFWLMCVVQPCASSTFWELPKVVRGNRILPSSCLDKEGSFLAAQHSYWTPHLLWEPQLSLCWLVWELSRIWQWQGPRSLRLIARGRGLSTAFLVVSAGSLVSKVRVDGNLSPPFSLLCVSLWDCRNHWCESPAAWDPSGSFANPSLSCRKPCLPRFMESVWYPLDFGSCGLLVC